MGIGIKGSQQRHHHLSHLTQLPTMSSRYSFGTRAIHIGSEPSSDTNAVIPPISLSTTFKQDFVGVHKVGGVFIARMLHVLTEPRTYRALSIQGVTPRTVVHSRPSLPLWRTAD